MFVLVVGRPIPCRAGADDRRLFPSGCHGGEGWRPKPAPAPTPRQEREIARQWAGGVDFPVPDEVRDQWTRYGWTGTPAGTADAVISLQASGVRLLVAHVRWQADAEAVDGPREQGLLVIRTSRAGTVRKQMIRGFDRIEDVGFEAVGRLDGAPVLAVVTRGKYPICRNVCTGYALYRYHESATTLVDQIWADGTGWGGSAGSECSAINLDCSAMQGGRETGLTVRRLEGPDSHSARTESARCIRTECVWDARNFRLVCTQLADLPCLEH